MRDLWAQAERVGPRRLRSIHFGGGTPSLMPPALIAAVIGAGTEVFQSDGDLEIGLEANPLDCERLRAIRDAGVERLSLGVQGLDDGELRTLGRDHDAAGGRRALEAALALFPRVSADLIYARPGQSLAAWRAELAEVARSGVGHISAYQLTYEPGTAFGRAAERGRLTPPDEEVGAAFYETTAEVLTAAGFEAYEVSNWARSAADRSRHNLGYWLGRDYLGVGPGAHGRLTIDGVRRATAGARRPADYSRRVAETGVGWDEDVALSAREAAEERVILGLRIADGVSVAELAPLDLPEARVPELIADGLLQRRGDRVAATSRGREVLDSLTRALAA